MKKLEEALGKSNWRKATILVTSIFLLCGLFNCFFFEVNDEPTFELMMRGFFWDTPVANFYFFLIGIAHIYKFLYSNLDFGINYFGLSLIITNFVSHIIFVYFILSKVKRSGFLLALVFLLISFSNLYLVSFTRTSILGALASLFLFEYSLSSDKTKGFRIFLFVASLVFFIFNYLLRPNGAILGFLIYIPFVLWNLIFEKRKYFFRKALLLLIPLIAGFAITNIIELNQDTTEDLLIKSNVGNIIDIVDYGRQPVLTNKEEEKTFFLIQNWFFLDQEVFSPNYRISRNSKILEFTSGPYIKSKINSVAEILLTNPIFLLLFIVSLSPLLAAGGRKNKQNLILLFFGVGYLAFVLAISFFMKIPPRIFYPVLTSYCFFLFIYFDQLFSEDRFKLESKLVPTLLVSFIFMGSAYFSDIYSRKKINNLHSLTRNEYFFSEPQKTILLGQNPLINNDPIRQQKFKKEIVRIPLFGWPSYNIIGQRKIEEISGSSDLTLFFDWTKNNHEQVVYFLPGERKNLLENIILTYGINGSFFEYDAPLKEFYFLGESK